MWHVVLVFIHYQMPIIISAVDITSFIVNMVTQLQIHSNISSIVMFAWWRKKLPTFGSRAEAYSIVTTHEQHQYHLTGTHSLTHSPTHSLTYSHKSGHSLALSSSASILQSNCRQVLQGSGPWLWPHISSTDDHWPQDASGTLFCIRIQLLLCATFQAWSLHLIAAHTGAQTQFQ